MKVCSLSCASEIGAQQARGTTRSCGLPWRIGEHSAAFQDEALIRE